MDSTAALSFFGTKTFRVVDPVQLDEQLKAEGNTLAKEDPSFIRSSSTEITTDMAETANTCDWYRAISLCAPTGSYVVK